MKMVKGLIAAIVLGGAAMAAPVSAATLIVNGGKLTGATGVTIAGKNYDVSFVDGTCAGVFGACTASNFTFTTAGTALAAGNALLSQVFLNVSAGLFDSKTNATLGCTSRLVCDVLIPYAAGRTTALVVDVLNSPLNAFDATFISTIGKSVSTSPLPALVYAKFSPTPIAAAVPESATWAMMLAGFGMMGTALRYRRRETKVAFA